MASKLDQVTSLFAPLVEKATGVQQDVSASVDEVKQTAVVYGSITAIAQIVTAVGTVIIAMELLKRRK
jgi:hypothetical protein